MKLEIATTRQTLTTKMAGTMGDPPLPVRDSGDVGDQQSRVSTGSVEVGKSGKSHAIPAAHQYGVRPRCSDTPVAVRMDLATSQSAVPDYGK